MSSSKRLQMILTSGPMVAADPERDAWAEGWEATCWPVLAGSIGEAEALAERHLVGAAASFGWSDAVLVAMEAVKGMRGMEGATAFCYMAVVRFRESRKP